LGKAALAGDVKAQQKLVNSNLRYAVKIAHTFRGYFKRPGISLSDIVQQANLGMIRAAKIFDPRRGNRFLTYAKWWMISYIHSYLMNNFDVIRTGRHNVTATLFFKMGKLVDIITTSCPERKRELREALSKDTCISIREIEAYEKHMNQMSTSLDNSMGEDDSSTWHEVIPGQSITPEEEWDKKRRSLRMRQAVTLCRPVLITSKLFIKYECM